MKLITTKIKDRRSNLTEAQFLKLVPGKFTKTEVSTNERSSKERGLTMGKKRVEGSGT